MLFVYVAVALGLSTEDAIMLSVHVPISVPFPRFFVMNINTLQTEFELYVNCREYNPE